MGAVLSFQPPLAELAGGSFIVLGVAIVLLIGIIYGYFTIKGSGISRHPSDGLDGAPGSKGPSQASGQGRVTGEADDSTPQSHDGMAAGDTFSSRGTGTSKHRK